jgi:hypothetical protein
MNDTHFDDERILVSISVENRNNEPAHITGLQNVLLDHIQSLVTVWWCVFVCVFCFVIWVALHREKTFK